MPIPSNTVSRMSCLANPSACCSSVRYARDIAINFQQCRHQFYCIDIKYPQIFAHPLLFRCSNQGGQLTIRQRQTERKDARTEPPCAHVNCALMQFNQLLTIRQPILRVRRDGDMLLASMSSRLVPAAVLRLLAPFLSGPCH